MPIRVQRSRRAGYRTPPGAIYCGRPTRLGNPFVPSDECGKIIGDDGTVRWLNGPLTRAGAVYLYRWARFGWSMNDDQRQVAMQLLSWVGGVPCPYIEPINRESLDPLRGHDLACWCGLDETCHVDWLLEAANGR